MPKHLVREGPDTTGEETFTWDEGIQKRFKFDTVDVSELESGEIVWRGNTAFYLGETTD